MRHCSVEADARTDLLGVIGTTVLSVIISFGIEVLVCMGINWRRFSMRWQVVRTGVFIKRLGMRIDVGSLWFGTSVEDKIGVSKSSLIVAMLKSQICNCVMTFDRSHCLVHFLKNLRTLSMTFSASSSWVMFGMVLLWSLCWNCERWESNELLSRKGNHRCTHLIAGTFEMHVDGWRHGSGRRLRDSARMPCAPK